MKDTRRKKLATVWVISLLLCGYFVYQATGDTNFSLATIFALISIAVGVPLMRGGE